MTHDTKCIFCRIVSGDAPSHKVFEDDTVLAFMDIYPASEGHVLVIPKEHCQTVYDITEAHVCTVSAVCRRVAKAIGATLNPDGLSIVQANGGAAGQTVMHYHVHVIPRITGQKLRLHGPRQAPAEQLAATAARLAEKVTGGG